MPQIDPSLNVLPERPAGELHERLARTRVVFTDLDGTMFGSGSCVLVDGAGRPSLAMLETLLDLRAAGVEVVLCSGRNRSMLHEDARVLGLTSYIGELGGIIMFDTKTSSWEYFTADMPYDPACGKTPHRVIEETGVLDGFAGRWPGLIEYHNDMGTGYKYREVTVALRGEIPDDEARALLAAADLPLDWGDNGFLNYISAPTTLHLPAGVPGRALNIMPGGLNKGRAITRFCEVRGIDPAETLAIGDSDADFLMADAVGTFLLMENGLKHESARPFLASRANAYLTRGGVVDGWVSSMRALLAARGAGA